MRAVREYEGPNFHHPPQQDREVWAGSGKASHAGLVLAVPTLGHPNTPRLGSQTLLSSPTRPSKLPGNKPGLAWPQMGAAGRILAPPDSSPRGWGLQEAWREGPPRHPGRCLRGVAHPIPAGKGVGEQTEPGWCRQSGNFRRPWVQPPPLPGGQGSWPAMPRQCWAGQGER